MNKFLQMTKFAQRLAASIIRSAWISIRQRPASKHLSFFGEAPDYPSSAGTPLQMLNLTGIGTSQTLTRLIQLGSLEEIQIRTAADLRIYIEESERGSAIEERLRNLFDAHGSDKGSSHGYSLLYAWLLEKVDFKREFRVLEIGLGTNRTTVPSNMGPGGRPGASLRAWRDMGETVWVVGLDVDRKILIDEERISSFYVDQLEPRTWASLPASAMGAGFDLIVDDGLHAPLANLNTVIASLPLLRKGGVVVIEDVAKRALPVWTLAKWLIDQSLEVSVYQMSLANCVVIRRKS